MNITSSSLHFENTILDGKKGNIKSTSTEIKDYNVTFTTLLIKTICNSSSSRLIDDTKDVKTSDETSILSSLTL